ncbi:MAG: type II toxin-antitoxin system HicB family antitoxin [Isosphaeraceae bacterium]
MSDPTLAVEPGISAPAPGGTIPVLIPIDLPARIRRDADGALWAEVPALPGCVAGGETLDELLANLREAAEGWLLAKQDIETDGWPRP